MHAMAKQYLSDLSLAPFTFLMAIVILVCSRKRQKLIPLLGLLTPILLFCIIALVYFGLMQGSSFQGIVPLPRDSFMQGLIGGYQTMDLIAAFIFATVIMPRFQTASGRTRLPAYGMSFAKQMVPPSIIAASLLFLAYIGLCLISSFHGSTLDSSCPSELLLSAIATKLLGPAGACIAAVAVIVACLTTAITLSVTFAEYVQSQTKINTSLALIGTLIITTLVANLGFEGIVTFLSPILQIIYPGLIVLTILNFLHRVYGVNVLKGPVFVSFVCSALFYFFKK
jgi:LIVCS family branched-chain amino acid:cation transporter